MITAKLIAKSEPPLLSFAKLFSSDVVRVGGREGGAGGVNGSEGEGEKEGGGYSRPNGPPAGHSVIHKMRPFSQTTLYPCAFMSPLHAAGM